MRMYVRLSLHYFKPKYIIYVDYICICIYNIFIKYVLGERQSKGEGYEQSDFVGKAYKGSGDQVQRWREFHMCGEVYARRGQAVFPRQQQ